MTRSSARSLLVPLTPLYRLVLSVRELRQRAGWEPIRRLIFPVISIGNLSTGGAGKTPFAVALARALSGRGFTVDVLSRGYGRRSDAPARIRLAGTPEEFGDEPLLMAREAGVPVFVARQRYEAGLLAEAGASPADGRPRVHILDDAFQHRQLYRDVDILMLNRADWEDRLLPAGNLREPLQAATRASVIAIPVDDPELEREIRAWGWDGPLWRIHRRMEVPALDGPVFAFCGIARPNQFFTGLTAGGAHLTGTRVFRDHHRYTADDLAGLQRAASARGALALITTEKDHVRLDRLVGRGSGVLPVLTAGLRIEIQDESAALSWLSGRLRNRKPVHLYEKI